MRLSDVVPFDKCLVTRVWGFSPESWGAMGFPKAGVADRWAASGETVRLVCFVSHNSADYIAEDDRGRVLGLYELVPQRVELEQDNVLDPSHLSDPAMRHPDGRFRWPAGLRAQRAWRFETPAPKTREAMPDARRLGFDVSTDLVAITSQDYELLDQVGYRLKETAVYGVERKPSRLAEPLAIPNSVYLFACAKREMLERMPGWRPGEILVKIGCTSDVGSRLASFNDHPLSRVFGLKLAKVAEREVGVAKAFSEEADLLTFAASAGRAASDLQTEFFYVSESAYRRLQLLYKTALRVA